ncbi:NAD(P)-dependent oxidoreductase [Paenibacillus pasadenensis]|uniref:NAD(P)-dependent oxidoreductase n=1 Tax=Paenibacillus pasadenensis TaxID=217090 RepID=UPI00203D0580|nr:NAD(P)-dependent oxidoreductase [Paenibacillus pasadenensis]MCM3745824.1 NAD(P)-dependent oxidoreductase [Paenibacillus pasadenensis]
MAIHHRISEDPSVPSAFREMVPPLSRSAAGEESNRCLYCYDAPCIKACPTSINIPSFIKRIATGNTEGAAYAIMDANPVGASCARVCPTELLCEGACVLNGTAEPIAIGRLQRYATDFAATEGLQLFAPGAPAGISAGVIGSGPAGLSAARELARFGFQVDVYEAKSVAGGLDSTGIVSFRLPTHVPAWEVQQVEALGVRFHTGVRIGSSLSAKQLLERHDAVVLAAGMGYVPPLGLEGEELEGVHDAIRLVEATKSGRMPSSFTGAKVAVIGAGNTAIDAATCSVRLGADKVKIVYRRTGAEMTAYPFEFEFAKQDGVEFEWLTQPVRIIGDEQGKVTGLECIRLEADGRTGPDGRRLFSPVPDSTFVNEADAVVFATGQQRLAPLADQLGISHQNGIPEVDPMTGLTSNPRIYAAGDVLHGTGAGEATVVSAAEQGKRAAAAIARKLLGEEFESYKRELVPTRAAENV